MSVKAASRSPARGSKPAAPSRGAKAGAAKIAAKAPRGHGAAKGGAKAAGKLPTVKDPRFQRMMEKLKRGANTASAHEPASKKAGQAEAAARPPANERLAGAQANKVDNMGAVPTSKPQPTSFLEVLRASIREVMPKKTKDAKEFMKGDDRDKLRGAMTGNIEQQKADSTAGMKTASEAPPDTSQIPEQPAVPLVDDRPAVPAPIAADQAMPPPKTQSEVSFDKNKSDTDKLMTDNELTTTQLNKANDPRFSAVVTNKAAADQLADRAPGQYRGREQGVLSTAEKQASGDEKKGLSGFLAQGMKSAQKVKADQLSTREKDELARKDVANHIESIFSRTKKTVDDKLANLDSEVETMFNKGVDAAIERMKSYVETRFDDRYSGVIGKGRWLKDKLLPLPDEVKEWFDQAHEAFTQDLDTLVVRVAALVERRLAEAKAEIARGQKEIRDYVAGLPASLKNVGEAAEREMNGRFDELKQSVEDKKGDLARSLAQRYKEATEKGDKALQDLRDAHKSLYEKVRDAVLTVIRILREFKDKVLALLRKAASVIGIIVSDPIAFLKNILAAISRGLGQFVDNIWTHLKQGFIDFLFGSLGEAGVTAPKDLSPPSILQLVLQVLGLTYERIRAKAVALLGERNVALIEGVAKAIKTLITEGPAKLWEMMKEYLSNLKEMVIDAVQDWLITTIIKAAVTKLVSMFNPVGAIIQAILTIYNVVMFLIERIQQIMAFVESVVNSVYDIATGAIGTAANWIEKALARTIPLIISFLARLLGLSGITDKIVSTIKKVQSKVDQAIDKVIGKIVAVGGKLFGAAKAGVKQLLNWWKFKTPIEGESGKKLTLYTEGEETAPKVLVASSPGKPWSEYLKGVTPTSPAAKTAHATATAIAKKLEAPRKPIAETDEAKRAKATAKAAQEMQESFNELAKQIKILNGKTATPASIITYGGVNGRGGGTKAEAKILSKDHPVGSAPRDYAPIWNDLGDLGAGLNKKVRHQWYVQGHLLNENLGGPGMRFNLSPLTKQANNKHKADVETDVKKKVNDDKLVVYYVVTAKSAWGASTKIPRLDQLEKLAAPSATEKAEIVSLKALRNLTRGFECRAYELEQNASGNWVKKKGGFDKAKTTIDNEIMEGGKPYGY